MSSLFLRRNFSPDTDAVVPATGAAGDDGVGTAAFVADVTAATGGPSFGNGTAALLPTAGAAPFGDAVVAGCVFGVCGPNIDPWPV